MEISNRSLLQISEFKDLVRAIKKFTGDPVGFLESYDSIINHPAFDLLTLADQYMIEGALKPKETEMPTKKTKKSTITQKHLKEIFDELVRTETRECFHMMRHLIATNDILSSKFEKFLTEARRKKLADKLDEFDTADGLFLNDAHPPEQLDISVCTVLYRKQTRVSAIRRIKNG